MRRILIIVIALVPAIGLAVPTARAGPPDAAHIALARHLPELKLDSVALGDAIGFITDVSGANLYVDWRALATINVTPDSLVNLRLRDVSLAQALDLILSDASGGGEALTFYLDRNVIEITTKAEADKQLFTIVIPVDDLLNDVPDFTDAPELNLAANYAGGNGAGNAGPFQANAANNQPGRTRQQKADDLISLIMSLIEPEIWRPNGGTASIIYFHGNLIINAPRSVIGNL